MKKLFSFLSAFLFTFAAFAQQIPNAGFENWQVKAGIGLTGPYSYDLPQNWQPGFVTEFIAAFGMKPNIGKSTTNQTGSFALKLSSNADTIGADVLCRVGLGTNAHPAALTGAFRTSGTVTSMDDYGTALVFLTKWNGTSSDTVGYGFADLDSSPNGFTAFTAPVTYQIPNVNPDSALVYFIYFPSTANTHLLIDNVAFTNMLGTAKEQTVFAGMKLFPNPVTANATLTFQNPKAGVANLLIRDLTGKTVKTIPLNNLSTGANSITLPTEDLSKGVYLATLQSDAGTQTLRFLKQ